MKGIRELTFAFHLHEQSIQHFKIEHKFGIKSPEDDYLWCYFASSNIKDVRYREQPRETFIFCRLQSLKRKVCKLQHQLRCFLHILIVVHVQPEVFSFRMWNFTTYLRSRDSERQIKIDPSIGSVPNYLQQLEPDQAQIRNLELLGLLHEQQGPSYLNHHHLVPSQGAHWQTGIPGPPASIAQSPRSILLFTSYFIRDFWLICLKNH